jgi:hypothetical protein
VVTIIFHPANPIAAGANRPPDRVLPRLCGGDLALNPREQLFRFREGQSQIGDIAEVIRLADPSSFVTWASRTSNERT